jgi:hypothetical protein
VLNNTIFALGTGTLPNLPTSGAIGAAAATVDLYSSMLLPQGTPNRVFTLPNPTNTTERVGQIFSLTNTGSVGFNCSGLFVEPGGRGDWSWGGTLWNPIALGGNSNFSWKSGLTGEANPIPAGVTISTPNTVVPPLANGGTVPAAVEYLRMVDGDFATPIFLSAVTSASRPITIVNNATFSTVLKSDGTTMGRDLTIATGEVVRLFPSSRGWEWTPPSSAPANLIRCVARGTIDIGDAVALGPRPITNAFNIASAVGGGSLTNSTLTITFTTPAPLVSYDIWMTLQSNIATAANAIQDNTLTTIVQSRTVNGFVVSTREWTSISQNVSLRFRCDVLY